MLSKDSLLPPSIRCKIVRRWGQGPNRDPEICFCLRLQFDARMANPLRLGCDTRTMPIWQRSESYWHERWLDELKRWMDFCSHWGSTLGLGQGVALHPLSLHTLGLRAFPVLQPGSGCATLYACNPGTTVDDGDARNQGNWPPPPRAPSPQELLGTANSAFWPKQRPLSATSWRASHNDKSVLFFVGWRVLHMASISILHWVSWGGDFFNPAYAQDTAGWERRASFRPLASTAGLERSNFFLFNNQRPAVWEKPHGLECKCDRRSWIWSCCRYMFICVTL